MLGKIGDILSILPILSYEHGKTGEKQTLAISKQYSGIVEGLDYVEALVIDCHWQDLEYAIKYCKRRYDKVVVAQTYGKTVAIQHRTHSFQYDQWMRAGMLKHWDNLPLVIPRPTNAKQLVDSHLGTRPSILFADSGESSQFEFSNQLAEALTKEFEETHNIVRLSTIRLERFTDFVALYDAADVLIVTETAHLHLSKASPTPTFALLTDKPQRWHGSAWSKQFGHAIRYSEYELREMEFINEVRKKIEHRKPIQIDRVMTGFDNGYNPSIIEFGDKKLMSYRHHPNPDEWRTNLVISEESGGVGFEYPLRFPDMYSDMSHEDGRFFVFNGKLHMSFTLSVFPGVRNAVVPCVTGYGELIKDESGWRVDSVTLPKYGMNNFQSQEKNMVFFEHESKLHCIYQCSPDHVVLRLGDGGIFEEVYQTESPSWKYGDIRGGTQPMRNYVTADGGWIRFFHSLHKNGVDRSAWTYHVGALVMEDKPPFAIKKISKLPVMSGNDRLVQGWKYWKPSVSIPYGAIERVDGWDVSIGVNDSECAIARVKREHLNL